MDPSPSGRGAALLWLLAVAVLGGIPGAAHGQSVEQGRDLYVARCLACHGTGGQGDGPASRALPRRPRDMTTAAFWQGMTDARLKAVIEAGRPGSPMRGFPMREEQMADLIAYLRTFDPT